MKQLIKNELYKQLVSKKLYIFIAVIVGFNFFGILEDLLGHVDFVMNGPNLPVYMLSTIVNYVLPFFIIFVATEMISHEYSSGTLKLSLLAPVKRSSLLVAKLSSLAILILSLLIFSYVMSVGIGTLYWGWSDTVLFEDPNLTAAPVEYSLLPGLFRGLLAYVVSVFPLMAFASFVIWLSFQFTSSGLSVGVSTASLILMGVFTQILTMIKPAFILSYFSLGILYFNPERFALTSAILSIVSYMLIFSFLSFRQFSKKDILL
ncbi:hypothetical protein EJF36_17920 [Bacillus sp. HMF5848]|uniref:ABC transporter permease n=1 Tax=Bacillus sp. HMF5848 TaxID=2495421 RepID=UPI000F79F011|nr:ABC transporter permease subunit [Bacillus sp. HMF5848]RSK28593.1 hypothetical protein EJF36_17920 [Bacillus sp. HMF5848]